ncbi:MAG: iron-sulfur cluster assembly accessory protein [Cytophagia bacterium]|nr:MAG: iron-sulfur cluster assembly accessory protein [Cytophagales bacterium]TAG41426.1 MAG: iron-sulfur cluster assembly accessory protein [Cytophagia bacterium]TAH28309.1 MAG: iron-sulfur cluster assembly accessory protein [Cytophagales bacterium]
MNLPIIITSKAKEKIIDIIQKKNISNDYALRIGSKGTGCNQNLYVGFDKIKESDEVFFDNNISIIIKKTQLMYIINVTLDYQIDKNTNEEGFIFSFL